MLMYVQYLYLIQIWMAKYYFLLFFSSDPEYGHESDIICIFYDETT